MDYIREEIANLCPVKIGDIYYVYDKDTDEYCYSAYEVTKVSYDMAKNAFGDIYGEWRAVLSIYVGKIGSERYIWLPGCMETMDCVVTSSGELYFDEDYVIRSRDSMFKLESYLYKTILDIRKNISSSNRFYKNFYYSGHNFYYSGHNYTLEIFKKDDKTISVTVRRDFWPIINEDFFLADYTAYRIYLKIIKCDILRGDEE